MIVLVFGLLMYRMITAEMAEAGAPPCKDFSVPFAVIGLAAIVVLRAWGVRQAAAQRGSIDVEFDPNEALA